MRYYLSQRKRSVLTCVFLGVLLAIIYGNSLHGEWHYDDVDIILHNPSVHLHHLSLQDIRNTFYYKSAMYRPVTCLTFGLNHYFGGVNVFGYHLVNLGIHCIAAVFLFLFLSRCLRLPTVAKRYESRAYSIALVATVLWAINPVQVLAVSYVVQRMASLAGMFYVMAMYFYLRGRTHHTRRTSITYYFLCCACTVLAFGSKENAVMLPLSLFVFDLFLIQGVTRTTLKKNGKVFLILAALYGIGIFLSTDMSAILSGYETRPFNLSERLLTEGRVIFYYISLLLYPIGSRLTFLHDIEISRSLFQPWTTLPALVLLASTVVYALVISRKRPLVSFCIIFFFLNHLIEGTFIPLEIIYEHRNYVPSLLFFVPVAICIMFFIDYFASRRSILWLTVVSLVFILAAQGHTVYVRNTVLRWEFTLWVDNAEKSPNLSLVRNNLGRLYLYYGLFPGALHEFTAALELDNYQNILSKSVIHCNLGQLFLKTGNNDRALSHFIRSLAICPGFAEPLSGIALINLRRGDPAAALYYIERACQKDPTNAEVHEYAGIILLRLGRFSEAYDKAKKTLDLSPQRIIPLAILADIYRERGDYKNAIRLWEHYRGKKEKSETAHFALIDLYHTTEKYDDLAKTVRSLLLLKGDMRFNDLFRKTLLKTDGLVYHPDEEKILNIINGIR